ncbi:hypothetical protein ACWGLP_36925, partial [Streptomyces lydicus]
MLEAFRDRPNGFFLTYTGHHITYPKSSSASAKTLGRKRLALVVTIVAPRQFRLDQSVVGPGVPLTDAQWARIEPLLPDR